MNELAKILFVISGLCLVLGAVLLVFNKIPWIGRLPGDIYIKKEHVTFYFPLATSILISIILSLLFMLFNRR